MPGPPAGEAARGHPGSGQVWDLGPAPRPAPLTLATRPLRPRRRAPTRGPDGRGRRRAESEKLRATESPPGRRGVCGHPDPPCARRPGGRVAPPRSGRRPPPSPPPGRLPAPLLPAPPPPAPRVSRDLTSPPTEPTAQLGGPRAGLSCRRGRHAGRHRSPAHRGRAGTGRAEPAGAAAGGRGHASAARVRRSRTCGGDRGLSGDTWAGGAGVGGNRGRVPGRCPALTGSPSPGRRQGRGRGERGSPAAGAWTAGGGLLRELLGSKGAGAEGPGRGQASARLPGEEGGAPPASPATHPRKIVSPTPAVPIRGSREPPALVHYPASAGPGLGAAVGRGGAHPEMHLRARALVGQLRAAGTGHPPGRLLPLLRDP